MKTTILMILAMFTANSAKADGFKCEGVNTGIRVKVYNHTEIDQGTRAVAVMVVSDSYVKGPHKTIAKFTDENRTLRYLGYGKFQAKVDLRYIESDKRGENIAGTKLGQLKNIDLQLFLHQGDSFTDDAASIFAHDKVMDATLTYLKRNGEFVDEKAICVRYLKSL